METFALSSFCLAIVKDYPMMWNGERMGGDINNQTKESIPQTVEKFPNCEIIRSIPCYCTRTKYKTDPDCVRYKKDDKTKHLSNLSMLSFIDNETLTRLHKVLVQKHI